MSRTGVPIDGDGAPGGSDVITLRVGRSRHFNYKEADGDVGGLVSPAPETSSCPAPTS